MNIAQAKQIALERVLLHIGAEKDLVRSNQTEVWFKSPMRPAEKTASFKIDVLKNLWFDHGEGVGGNIIKLGQKHLATESVSDVLKWLDGIIGNLPRLKQIKAIQPPKKQDSSPINSGLLLLKEKKSWVKIALISHIYFSLTCKFYRNAFRFLFVYKVRYLFNH